MVLDLNVNSFNYRVVILLLIASPLFNRIWLPHILGICEWVSSDLWFIKILLIALHSPPVLLSEIRNLYCLSLFWHPSTKYLLLSHFHLYFVGKHRNQRAQMLLFIFHKHISYIIPNIKYIIYHIKYIIYHTYDTNLWVELSFCQTRSG